MRFTLAWLLPPFLAWAIYTQIAYYHPHPAHWFGLYRVIVLWLASAALVGLSYWIRRAMGYGRRDTWRPR